MIGDIEAKLKAVDRLVRLFRWERITYISMAGIALAMLIAATAVLIAHDQIQLSALALIIGGAGVLIFAIGRVLQIWEQAHRLMGGESSGRSTKND